jgi:(2Fe-2S) ferredoxin
MNRQPVPYRKIVFVCTNQRDDPARPCCSGRKSAELYARLKEMIKERKLRGRVRVSKSGCLDRCESGPNIMLFPDNIWYSGVQESDLETLFADIASGLEPE